ncbi:shugoshin c terminal domain-containing protein [Diplodia corticola]|uniref:Shugoshin c terminal domain-containing protein n=1 Tax=Diplodia corticola TaxID=236234 RepID=A0A1J9QPJ7_9PEZI|nr:shugoshin c terminal domain-containing protein [Diplodia corticola]OJD29970.1 shugoshin c terminal domain-containing protein [Diplodia corticola]
MARLNEAPPPQETVDQLKRRFIRQNRELAKNNSAQSVRIRALENEQARILAENLSLREQIINLQTELEQIRGPNALQQISSVKDQLESKLLEIGSLVAELSSINKPSHKARQSDAGPSRAVEHFEWRRAMKEQAGEQDDDEVLPTIREDKHYPRRTLDADELHAVLTTTTDDSPNLGPPPVAHFTEEDPIKFDPEPANEDANNDMDVDQKDEEVLPATMSVNLETRRKRRDSSKLDLRKMSVFQTPEEANKEDSNDQEPSKVGRKRKLSVTAEETNGDAGDRDYRDDFRFSRRGGDRENRQPLEPTSKQNLRLDIPITTDRKALGDKTNTSPKKVQRSDSKSDAKKLEIPKEAARNRVRERKSRAAMINVAPKETTEVVETAEIEIEEPQEQEQPELPPKTPAGLDLASPTSTEPSAARQESKDTPPPGDLAATNSETSAAGRPSRRARPQVNYAEPSLVSKMRRPTKTLVDAVVDSRRSSDAHSEQGQSASGSANPLRTIVIKRERQEDAGSAWKTHTASSEQTEPHSPLSSKTAAAQLAFESQTKEPEDQGLKQADDKPTSTNAGKDLLSRSISGASSRRKGATAKSSSTDSIGKDHPDLAIFDFNITDGSSPSDEKDVLSASRDQNVEQIMKSSRALAAKSASRRHSSVMSTSTKERGSVKELIRGSGRETGKKLDTAEEHDGLIEMRVDLLVGSYVYAMRK